MIRREVLHGKKSKPLKSVKTSGADVYASANSDLQGHSSPPGLLQRAHSTSSMLLEKLKVLPDTFPTTKDAYKLLNKCGEGATAEVYRAWCNPMQEEVAIKLVDLESAGQNLDTIIKEAQLMSGFRHPNVLSLLACFVESSYLWMVLPYVPGGSVQSAMDYAFPKGLEERVIAPIMTCVLKALEYLHARGVVHRDVKASNILLERDNALLSDFGIACLLERNIEEAQKRKFGQYLSRSTFVGTPVWMAPEVMEQAEGHGRAADIYSFGITLLELARGKAPFAGMPFEVVAMNKLHHPSPTLPAMHEGRLYSEDMQETVAMCLRQDPAKRPTASQLLKHRFFKWTRPVKDAVDELLSGVPGPVQRLTSLTRRTHEAQSRPGYEEGSSLGADNEVASLLAVKRKDGQRAAMDFDAADALHLLHSMLQGRSRLDLVVEESDLSSTTPKSSAGTPTRRLSKKKSLNKIPSWPHLPPTALQHCRSLLFSSAGRKGFGLQTTWGHGFLLSHLKSATGLRCWSGPCYVYITGGNHVGLGETTREAVVLFSDEVVLDRLRKDEVLRISEMKVHDAVEEQLDCSKICQCLQNEQSASHGVAFRHYRNGKAWKKHGVVHVDHAANGKVYGRPVSPEAIFAGKVPPPVSFRQLIDVLISCEENRYEKPAIDTDSDSSRGKSTPTTPNSTWRSSSPAGKRTLGGNLQGPQDSAYVGVPDISPPVSVFSGQLSTQLSAQLTSASASALMGLAAQDDSPQEAVPRSRLLRESASEPLLCTDAVMLERLTLEADAMACSSDTLAEDAAAEGAIASASSTPLAAAVGAGSGSVEATDQGASVAIGLQSARSNGSDTSSCESVHTAPEVGEVLYEGDEVLYEGDEPGEGRAKNSMPQAALSESSTSVADVLKRFSQIGMRLETTREAPAAPLLISSGKAPAVASPDASRQPVSDAAQGIAGAGIPMSPGTHADAVQRGFGAASKATEPGFGNLPVPSSPGSDKLGSPYRAGGSAAAAWRPPKPPTRQPSEPLPVGKNTLNTA